MPIKHTTWTYRIKGDVIFLTSNGVFSAVTDYGNYAHHWPPAGFHQPDFRKELLRMHDEYIVRKLTYSCPEVYSAEGTLRAAKEHIIFARRDGSITKELAREEWDSFNTYSDFALKSDFYEWYHSASDFWDSPSDIYRTEHEPSLVRFVEKYLPLLREAIHQELAAEAALAADYKKSIERCSSQMKDSFFTHGECA